MNIRFIDPSFLHKTFYIEKRYDTI